MQNIVGNRLMVIEKDFILWWCILFDIKIMSIWSALQSAIWQCLNNYDYADAVFLSERLYAEGEGRCVFFV